MPTLLDGLKFKMSARAISKKENWAKVTGYFPCDCGTYQQSQVVLLLQLGRWPIQTALQIVIATKLPDVGALCCRIPSNYPISLRW